MAALVERADNAGLIAEPAPFTFHGCAYFVHREVFNRVGGFDEFLWLLNDWNMWFRMLREGVRLHYISKALVIGRVHPAQVSGRHGYSYQNREQDFYWQRCLDYLMTDASENPSLLRRFGRNAYQKTRYEEADCAFQWPMKAEPKKKRVLKLEAICLKLWSAWHNGARKWVLRLLLEKR